jgi:DNA-binding transcriptional LysR family regulator
MGITQASREDDLWGNPPRRFDFAAVYMGCSSVGSELITAGLSERLLDSRHAVRNGIGSIIGPRNLFHEGKDFTCPLPNLDLRGQPYLLHHRAGEPKYVERFLKWLNDEARKDER